jgi:hypothetical protein
MANDDVDADDVNEAMTMMMMMMITVFDLTEVLYKHGRDVK